MATIKSPSLAGGSDFFVNSQLDSSKSLLLGYYNLRGSPTANTGVVQSPALAAADSAKVAASGDLVAVTYEISSTVYFVLLRRDGNSTSAFSQVRSKSLGSGSQPWIALHSNGWILLYVNSGIQLASFGLTTGADLKTAAVDSGTLSLPSLGTSTGPSFVFSYNKELTLNNELRTVVAAMASDGTFTTQSNTDLGNGKAFYAVPSRAAIAPGGKAFVSYIKSNNNYAFVTITAGTASAETVLQASATTSAAVLSLSPGYFVALWEVSSAVRGMLIPADGSATTPFNVANGATSPTLAALGPYRFIIGWATTASTAKSATQHFAIQHCGDGFVTSNESCDSGEYCLGDCTCPVDQGPLGSGCTAPGVPFTIVPVSSPLDSTPSTATPTDGPAGTPSNEPSVNTPSVSNEPTMAPISTPSLDAAQTPADPLDQLVGDSLTVRNLIVILGVVVAAALGVTLLVILLRRRKRLKQKSSSFPGGDDGPRPSGYDPVRSIHISV